MPEPKHSSELEKAVKDVTTVPEPDAEFIHSLRARFVAEGHASAIQHQEIQMKQRSTTKRLEWAAVAFVLVALAVLSTNPTVVNALKRLFGYVPNVGIIDQSSQVRMLTEPITITRDGYTVIVEQAVLNDEKTAIVYSYSLPPDYVFFDNDSVTNGSPFLTLPDGARLDIMTGRHLASTDCPQCYLRYLMEFPPLSADINEVTLEIPDLAAAPDDTTPTDWKFQLQFKPADPADIAPVIEQVITPVPTALHTDAPTPSVNTFGIINSLDKFVALPDGYILYGHTTWTDTSIPPYGVSAELAIIRDAAGKEIPFDYEMADTNPAPGELSVSWAYKVGMDFTAPLTLDFVMLASVPADGGSFTFDPGPDPQPGQKWNIDQDVTANGQIVHVLSAELVDSESGFFIFSMQSDSNITGVAVMDLVHPPLGGGGGGGGIPSVGAPFNSGLGYQGPIPPGPLTLTFTNLQLLVPGDWAVNWGP